MADFLTAVSTTTVRRSMTPETPLLEATTTKKSNGPGVHVNLESPEEIAKALKDQPGFETVGKILRRLSRTPDQTDNFNLVNPTPIAAQIVDTLVVTIIPDYWKVFKDSKKSENDLITCLQTPNGLGAILSRLRPLIADCRQKTLLKNTRDASAHIEDLLEVIEKILAGDQSSCLVWERIRRYATNPTQKKLMWKEYVSQVASGRILSVVAEAEGVLKERGSERKPSWVGTGAEYASWLGRNIAVLVKESIDDQESSSAVTDMFTKAMMLGYIDRIVGSIIDFMITEGSTNALEKIFPMLKAYEQRKYFDAIITHLARRFPGPAGGSTFSVTLEASATISGVARLLHSIMKGTETLRDHIVTVLTRSSIPSLDDSLATRRSVIAAISEDEEKLHTILEKSLRTFGDAFYIKHTPLIQQEALAQTLLIVSGYVQRTQPMFMTMMAKSSYHMSGTSNRIGATSPKARFLGMVVGCAISKKVDKPELQLKFDFQGPDEDEARWYQRLTEVNDQLGNLESLKKTTPKKPGRKPKQGAKGVQQRKSSEEGAVRPSITEISGPRIVEIIDQSSDEDDDLIAYEKPDSDPEDDTEDPTELNRNKPTAPVYIRDLIAGLRDQENYDRHQLALATAASLIRRKANFGSEVTDHLDELASLLTGLHDNYDLPNFNEQQQQALIAVLLAKPAQMAQWFARAFFSGDFSIAQRTVMLTTLGLGARELAGLKDSSTENLLPPSPAFPSKQLPPNLHKVYAEESDPVAKITGNLTKQLLSPMAADAADKLTGPDVLKVRTFSSRMQVEKQRSKPIPNALAQIVADNFFFPLTGRWWINTRSGTSDNLYTSTHLLPAFLHTLALLMHASGQNTLALPQMTREFWELLLSVRTIAVNDKAVLNALLFALLMLVETNENKERLATEQAKELLETQQWVRVIFENLGAGSEEDEKVRVLAAGVLVRCQEVVDKYQRRMVGSMMDY